MSWLCPNCGVIPNEMCTYRESCEECGSPVVPCPPPTSKVVEYDGGPAFPFIGTMPASGVDRPLPMNVFHVGMSLREYAAIELRVPCSGVAWLDDAIRQSNHMSIAGQAAAAIAAAASSDVAVFAKIAAICESDKQTPSETMADLAHETAAKVISFMGDEWNPQPAPKGDS